MLSLTRTIPLVALESFPAESSASNDGVPSLLTVTSMLSCGAAFATMGSIPPVKAPIPRMVRARVLHLPMVFKTISSPPGYIK